MAVDAASAPRPFTGSEFLECMAEYDLDGWTAPDLITPSDVNLFLKRPD